LADVGSSAGFVVAYDDFLFTFFVSVLVYVAVSFVCVWCCIILVYVAVSWVYVSVSFVRVAAVGAAAVCSSKWSCKLRLRARQSPK
jgi:hypothetical protein